MIGPVLGGSGGLGYTKRNSADALPEESGSQITLRTVATRPHTICPAHSSVLTLPHLTGSFLFLGPKLVPTSGHLPCGPLHLECPPNPTHFLQTLLLLIGGALHCHLFRKALSWPSKLGFLFLSSAGNLSPNPFLASFIVWHLPSFIVIYLSVNWGFICLPPKSTKPTMVSSVLIIMFWTWLVSNK